MVGASGAISGVLGAYVLLHPQATVRVLLILGVFVTIAHVPALIVLGIWFLTQIASAALSQTDGPGVAFWAHVGGFVAGMALVPFFKRSEVPLFQPPHSRPFEIERRRGPWG
jgi:membrane associated rhomboid family serine protease